MNSKLIRAILFGVLALLLSSGHVVQAAPHTQALDPSTPMPPGLEDPLIEQLQQAAGGRLQIVRHTRTGKVNLIGASQDHPIGRPAKLAATAAPEAVARAFMETYGPLFGLRDQAQELRVGREEKATHGNTVVHFQQVYQNIPVLAGDLNISLDAAGNVLSANGELVPDLQLDVAPIVAAKTAQQLAQQITAQSYGLPVDALSATEPQLWIYSPGLLDEPGPDHPTLVWRMDVQAADLQPVRELVLIDAQNGIVVLHFNQIDTVLNRQTNTANNGTALPGTLVCNEQNPQCTGGDTHAVAAHRYAGHTYDFYFNRHNRDSIDNQGMALISTVHYGNNYQNAFWNGTQMVYGDKSGFPLADDVVGHELTHGVTAHTSGLLYRNESGAINESLSDIWGELIDLSNGAGDDGAAVRWQLGEDITGLGAIRDMQDPPLFQQPDRMLSPLYRTPPSVPVCSPSDPNYNDCGWVHTNSGVNNKAAYLLVDGDTFNGLTITALGIDKTARIYYEAQTHLLTSSSNYRDLYYLLQQACMNLIGTAGITTADCEQVHKAVTATEMAPRPPYVVTCESGESRFVCDTQLYSTSYYWQLVPDSAGRRNGVIKSGQGSTSIGGICNGGRTVRVRVTVPSGDYDRSFYCNPGLWP
jgi:Zn-dependent metalloprotease